MTGNKLIYCLCRHDSEPVYYNPVCFTSFDVALRSFVSLFFERSSPLSFEPNLYTFEFLGEFDGPNFIPAKEFYDANPSKKSIMTFSLQRLIDEGYISYSGVSPEGYYIFTRPEIKIMED